MGSADPPAAASLPDWATLAALAVLAGALTTVLHEGVGHGGACWLTGGHNLLISSVAEECSVANPWIDAAGTLVNLAAGALFWWLGRRTERPHLRFFCWLTMAFNLLTAAGYWLYSGIANIGDWAAIIAGRQPVWLWHTGMVVIGAAAYLYFVRLAAWELKPLLPRACPARVARAQRYMLVAYFAFGIFNTAAAVLNPVGALLIAESAAAASFGGASGLCWGWTFVRHPYFAQAGPELRPLTRNYAWIAGAVVVGAAFIALLGPGWRP